VTRLHLTLVSALAGCVVLFLDHGRERPCFHPRRSYEALYVSAMIWRELDNCSSGSVCMVLASTHYDEADYFRDYDEYLAAQELRP